MDSEILATRSILRSGVLGEVTHYECHMDRFRPLVRQRWREDPGPGAGLWFDLGPHLIDQAVHLFGLPEAVSASIATLRPGARTDDWAHVQLLYPRLRVILHTTLLAAGSTAAPRSTLHGTRGSWIKYGADIQEDQLKAGISPVDPTFGIDSTPGILIDATGIRTEVPAPRGDQRQYYLGMRDAILTRQPAPIAARDAVATMAILETSFQSAAEGRAFPIPLTIAECAAFALTR